MAVKTLTIKESAYKALKQCKLPGESFSDVIEREMGQKITTTKDLLEWAKARMGTRTGMAVRHRKGAKSKAA
ncbi:MAG TPA: antitoxin VapB family protein [Opitutaceae bacterium]